MRPFHDLLAFQTRFPQDILIRLHDGHLLDGIFHVSGRLLVASHDRHGGKDEEANWVCCSMLTNQIKANWTLEELEWELKPPGDLTKWDGLLNWFIAQMRDESVRLAAPKYCRDWLSAAQACSF